MSPRSIACRTLLVPNIKDAQRLDFATFMEAYDGLVERARRGNVSPGDFMGTTVSLTNPGMLGTTFSAPRLLPGQGLIVAVGTLDYPSEYRSMTARTLMRGSKAYSPAFSVLSAPVIRAAIWKIRG